ncbi:hypothetical protein [Demequina lutea]|uniref:Uncharacterized protein n=1 Tax=Demequina lutea TaxID=431489 RepID=A0A7Y9ZDU7_9MICO|nr:hypothetical protein [Demequina lutea]NYI42428.1 hypothetical protein [Demequina lutea]
MARQPGARPGVVHCRWADLSSRSLSPDATNSASGRTTASLPAYSRTSPGVPGRAGFGFGAIGEGWVRMLDVDVVAGLGLEPAAI